MGRKNPSRGIPPPAQRKEARAKEARTLVSKTIPVLLLSNIRARKGIDAAELIANPPRFQSMTHNPPTKRSPFALRLIIGDTLTAALHIASASRSKRNVAVLNMASPLRPGGGLLNGATSQEESLCLRTTLYPSLREEFYRLPEVGAIFTPDVLVFRDEGGKNLEKSKRWCVDVVSAGMLRFPDIDEGNVNEEDLDDDETTKGRTTNRGTYASVADKQMVESKMRAVMRVLCLKKVQRVVLGAWGCGAYGNPIAEIATAWRRVLVGGQKQQQDNKQNIDNKEEDLEEKWSSLDEVVFAIKDKKMAKMFAKCFGGELILEAEPEEVLERESGDDEKLKNARELRKKMEDLETQINQVQNANLKVRLEYVLQGLQKQLDAMDHEDEEDTTIGKTKDYAEFNDEDNQKFSNENDDYRSSYVNDVDSNANWKSETVHARKINSKNGNALNPEEQVFDSYFFDGDSTQTKWRHGDW